MRTCTWMVALVCLGLCLQAAAPLHATEYFVATKGDDGSDGLSEGSAFATVTKGVAVLKAGDILTVLPGTYRESVSAQISGEPGAPITIRTKRPGTVLLRGDVDSPQFRRDDRLRYTYWVDFAQRVEGVAERSTFHTYEPTLSVDEVEQNLGTFYQDEQTGRLYVHTSDSGDPNWHALSISVTNSFGILLTPPRGSGMVHDVVVDGLSFTGYQARDYPPEPGSRSRWGLHVVRTERVVVRRCTAFLNSGGIYLLAANECLVEDCYAFGNFSRFQVLGHNILGWSVKHTTFRRNVVEAFPKGSDVASSGDITFYGGGPDLTDNLMEDNLAIRACVFIKGHYGEDTVERRNVAAGRGANFFRFLAATELLVPDNESDRARLIYADPLNHDYRLQSDAAVRGTGPDGTDPGQTVYVAAGGAANIKHPVLDHGVDPADAASYEKAAERTMAMSEEEMLSYIPEKHFTRFCDCPECFGGVDADMVFDWSIDRPNELKCRFCGFVWRPDGKYPETAVLTGKNALGETRMYNYYYDEAHKTSHHFSRYIDLCKRAWIHKHGRELAQAYLATGNSEYAYRVALILDRMAETYRHMAVIKCGGTPNRYFKVADSQEPPYTWDSGRWGWHSPGGELPSGAIEMYDMIYDSDQLDRLSEERGYDVREKIEKEFFLHTLEAVAATRSHVNNYVAYLGSAINMARVIDEPKWVHWAFRWIGENVNAGCFYDGMWHESPAYHYMTISGLRRCFAAAEGYTDPPGYVDEVDGRRYEGLDPAAELPFWTKVQDAPLTISYPSGDLAVVHDTWAKSRRGPAREETTSTILPGFGHASLGRGRGADQMQAQLHFSGSYGHAHRDNLQMTLWAKGKEMLSDIGYTWSDIRHWLISSISHNLVAVDCKEQTGRPSDGDLQVYFPAINGISLVEADGKRGYGNIADLDRYRRLLLMVSVSDADAYVVDVFWTRGGSVHDWLLHGDADEDTEATCAVVGGEPLASLPIPDAVSEGASAKSYCEIRDLKHGVSSEAFVATFSYPGDTEHGVAIHMLNDSRSDIYLGRSPSVRRTGTGTNADNRSIYDYWMPHLVVRRTGDAPLASTFAAVYEPFKGKRFLESVKPVAVTPADGTAKALQVRHREYVDTIVVTLDESPYPQRVAADGTTLRGRVGVVRRKGNDVIGTWLIEGTELNQGTASLVLAEGAISGEIIAATREADGDEYDAFVTTAELATGEQLKGAWMIVTHGNGCTHGYPIERTEVVDGKTRIVLGMDHGLRIEGSTTTEIYHPQRTIEGINEFRIPLGASAMTIE